MNSFQSKPSAPGIVPLTLAEASRMIQDALKDKSYRQSPLGALVGRYIRWFRNEWGATESSVRDYEAILARMSVTLAHREPAEVTIEDCREVIDFWAGKTKRTRAKVTSVIKSFWLWAEDQEHVDRSPATKIRRPRAERKVVELLPLDARPRLLTQAKPPRDRLGLFCLLVLGLRRGELAGIQVRDFDAQRGVLRVRMGKGQKQRLIPLRGPILAELRLYLASDLPHLQRPPKGDDYLIYPVDLRAAGKGEEGQLLRRYLARPKDKPSPKVVHHWWYRQAQAAGLVMPGVTAGFNMHRARHTFAVELRRVAGIESASQALGHSDLNVTLSTYGHMDETDLERAMESYAEWLEQPTVPAEATADLGSLEPVNGDGGD